MIKFTQHFTFELKEKTIIIFVILCFLRFSNQLNNLQLKEGLDKF
jgi:hypothetical protein